MKARRATLYDAQTLRKLCASVADDPTAQGVVQFTPEDMHRMLAHACLSPDTHGLFLLTTECGMEVFGFAWAYVMPLLDQTKIVHIDQAWMYRDFRGTDLAHKVYALIEEWARQVGARQITLVSRKTDKDGFLKYGFEPVHLAMVKKLEE